MHRVCVRGLVRSGQVVLEAPLELPDGTAVELTVPESAVAAAPTKPPISPELIALIAGMWADRPEMADPEQWVRRMRGARE